MKLSHTWAPTLKEASPSLAPLVSYLVIAMKKGHCHEPHLSPLKGLGNTNRDRACTGQLVYGTWYQSCTFWGCTGSWIYGSTKSINWEVIPQRTPGALMREH